MANVLIHQAEFTEVTTPATPTTGTWRIYPKTTGWVQLDDAGVETSLTGAGTDTTAIHDDTASEISAVTAKATPAVGDFILIEDSAASNVKKSITVGSLFDRAVVINESGASVNFRVETPSGTHSFYVSGASGNVGINNSSPGNLLHLEKNSASSGSTIFPAIRVSNPSTATHSFSKMQVDSNNSAIQLIFLADGLGTGSEISGSTAGGALGTQSNHILAIITNATERARFDTSGNLVIAGTTASAVLDVQGTFRATGVTNIGDGTAAAQAILNKVGGNSAVIDGQTAGTIRWRSAYGNSTAETGSNAGSDFVLQSFNDAGSLLTNNLVITRSSGLWTITGGVIISTTTGTLRLPSMTTTQRDALTPANGDMIYNTTTGVIEARESGAWVNL